MLTNIDINKINPHPKNPRKDLGDLTELAESIKAKGILQSLTVVPADIELFQKKISSKKAYTGEYTAVIGHRRLAASKIAGLSEILCTVSEMDEKEQIETMLLENIQRNDLTIWEQAQGFQMMLDMGDSISDLTKRTGFSDTTIRKRMKLLELDPDKFKESVERGATLQDYAELDKIKDINLRNKALESIGTSNFKWALQNAVDEEKKEKYKAELIAILDTFATPVESQKGYRTAKTIYYYNKPDFQKPEDAGDRKYYYYFSPPCYIYLLIEDTQDETDKEANTALQKAQQELQERRSRLDNISNSAFKLRLDFIKNYTGKQKHTRDIMEFATRTLIEDRSWFKDNQFLELLDIELGEDDELIFGTISDEFAASPERVLLLAAYCTDADSERWTYYDYNCKYQDNDDLNEIYDFLEKLGYQTSDEEKALRDGTHELFVNSNEG